MTPEIFAFLSEYGFPASTLADLREYFEAQEARGIERAEENDRDITVEHSVSFDSFPAVLDQRTIMDGRQRLWYLLATTPSHTGGHRRTTKRGICCHHTAVHRGFGIHESTLAAVKAGSIPIPKLLEWPDDAPHGDVVDRAVALAARYRGVRVDGPRGKGVPYHAISSANSVLTLHLPFELVAWHGNGANNDYLGWAWDGHSRHDKLPISDLRADLHHLISIARDEGHPIEEITTHSVYANKPTDPGREFIRGVILPVAEETGCTVDLDEHHGTGRPLREVLS